MIFIDFGKSLLPLVIRFSEFLRGSSSSASSLFIAGYVLKVDLLDNNFNFALFNRLEFCLRVPMILMLIL